jgi:prepilin-type N-terminal cleavage/methylation domain-containing protein
MTSPTGRTRRPGRGGFTLVELLIVLLIIALLASLGVSAIMKMMALQQRRNTEQLVTKVDQAFNRHWKVVIDQAKLEQPSPIAQALSNGDDRRAKVIHVLLCLRREFPMNFAEATTPLTLGTATFPPNPVYARSIPALATWGSYSWEQQSSICLYTALKQRRGGIDFDPDTSLSSQELITDPNGAKMIVDAWARPVIFNRWPSPPPGPPVQMPLAPNQGYFASYGFGVGGPPTPAIGTLLSLSQGSPPPMADPQDPEWLLTTSAWVSTPSATALQSIGYPIAGANQQFVMTPVIMSMGYNGKYDGSNSGADDIINFQIR